MCAHPSAFARTVPTVILSGATARFKYELLLSERLQTPSKVDSGVSNGSRSVAEERSSVSKLASEVSKRVSSLPKGGAEVSKAPRNVSNPSRNASKPP